MNPENKKYGNIKAVMDIALTSVIPVSVRNQLIALLDLKDTERAGVEEELRKLKLEKNSCIYCYASGSVVRIEALTKENSELREELKTWRTKS